MSQGKLHFGFGLAAGVVIAACFLLIFAPRYTITTIDGTQVKQDKWSGKTWRYSENEWRMIKESQRDWSDVDGTLRKALNIPEREKNQKDSLSLLRSQYPPLKDISDEDLLERIKLVYARDILGDMYLQNFLRLHQVNSANKVTE